MNTIGDLDSLDWLNSSCSSSSCSIVLNLSQNQNIATTSFSPVFVVECDLQSLLQTNSPRCFLRQFHFHLYSLPHRLSLSTNSSFSPFSFPLLLWLFLHSTEKVCMQRTLLYILAISRFALSVDASLNPFAPKPKPSGLFYKNDYILIL